MYQPPVDPASVRLLVIKALGKPPEELFASFDEKPIGSASIAQVHFATLHDGSHVAVKLRRPGIVEKVDADLLRDQLNSLNNKIDAVPAGPPGPPGPG